MTQLLIDTFAHVQTEKAECKPGSKYMLSWHKDNNKENHFICCIIKHQHTGATIQEKILIGKPFFYEVLRYAEGGIVNNYSAPVEPINHACGV